MTLFEFLLLAIAAVGAGALNAVVGAGTLITFSTLLMLGYPPVVANVANKIGLVPGGAAAVFAFRKQLAGRWHFVGRLVAVTATAGLIGGILLLALPPGAFEIIVPVLLVLAGLLAALQPRAAAAVMRRRAAAATARAQVEGRELPDTEPIVATPTRIDPLLFAGVAAVGVYGGYFGAAQGVLLLAVLGVFVPGDMAEINGIKNVLQAVANLVSGVLFIVIAEVDWAVAATIAFGATIGGGLGGRYGRRLPAGPLRILIVVVALVAAVGQIVS